MAYTVEGKLVVAISSRALFDFEEENRVFDARGERAYIDLQNERLNVPAKPGVAFGLVRKLLAFNTPDAQHVEVVILSKNDPVSGLRIFRSAERAGLRIERGVFTRGRSPYRYLDALRANLFLSANEQDVMGALDARFPAARVLLESSRSESNDKEVRIAFDGDAVLFSDEAERIYQSDGLEAFTRHETEHALTPLPPGPFKPLLEALHRLQVASSGDKPPMRLRTALVTARSAPAHERAVRTLVDWNISVDEALFLGGLDKGEFLKAFQPDFYFDDQRGHVESARQHVATGHVPFGIANQGGVKP